MKNCVSCNQSFEIEDHHRDFLAKIAVKVGNKRFEIPEPSHCPLCRQQRRFAFRNERNLYRRKCDGSGKEIISLYGEDSPYKIFAQDVWWQSNWDGTEFGVDFDFSRPFFDQFADLIKRVPRIAVLNVNSENSQYCNFTGDVKNCYLIFGPVYSEDCFYGSPYYSKDCVDTLVLRDCELCYECIDCRKLYNGLYCQDCNYSNDLLYCYDLQGCSECIGCVGLRRKKYCMFNEQLTKEAFLKRKKQIDLCDFDCHRFLEKGLNELKLKMPHRAMLAVKSENVSGSHVFESKNTYESFFADRCEDCAYCAQVVDLKDCYDNNYTEENELCYEYLGMYATRYTLFSILCRHTNNAFYCDYCVNCEDIFGCSNLRDKRYCILNKQYSREEYFDLLPRVIECMKVGGAIQTVYPAERGSGSSGSPGGLASNSTEWGEFFPIGNSPFAYNETVAQEYFPMTKSQVLEKGWTWKDDDEKEFQAQTVEFPSNIKDVSEDICYEILACEVTGRNYRVIPQELQFYKRMGLPIPRKHPDQRHIERIGKRNPRRLWDRECQRCHQGIKSTYAPGREERVYCEGCYLEEVT